MKELAFLSLLIEQYKIQFNCEDIPEEIKELNIREKIELIVEALNNNKKIENLNKKDISISI